MENQNKIQILSGVLDFRTQNYNEATAEFLKGEEMGNSQKNSVLKSVSGFNLATTYLILNENEVAADKFDKVETTEFLKFPIEFNKGIVAHRKGDNISAARHFKNALKLDPSNIDAKINLEIVQSKIPVASSENHQQETMASESSENSAMTEGIFSVIREADGKQWKSEQKTSVSNSPDY
ncbi:MAG: tetratricopeptide repeat protein [Spirochaetaceae bacterium]|nr:tetratricopeptide repeat protein [Spirochaetaceae bacterium]